MKDDFKFYVPINLSKGKKTEGAELTEMLLEGLAGDGSSDSEGENLTYNGFDLSRMYYINWEHSKDPDDVIGVILRKELQKGGKLFIKGKLFDGHTKAVSAYKLQEFLEKEGHNLGFSVEGKVISRDPINPKVVTKAELYGVALCKVPVNPLTYARIAKAFSGEEDIEEEEEENMDSVEKMSTGDMAPAMPESVEKKKKISEKDSVLTKSQIYSRIFNSFTSDPVLADSIYHNILKPISKMKNDQITEDVLKKAQEILGLATGESASNDLEKGAQGDMNVGGEENGGDITTLKKAYKDSKKDFLEKAKAYQDMCKAKGEKFEDDEDDSSELKKSLFPEAVETPVGGISTEILKSVMTEVLGDISGSFEKIEKSVAIRTTALGTLFNSQAEKINSLSEELQKANSTIEKLDEYNEDFRTRLGVVESTPIRKSVTTENFKERFPENKTQPSGANTFNINSKVDRERLEKSIDAVYGNDLTNPENQAMLEAVATLQMTGTVMEGQQALLKAKGYELVAM